jgi:cytochrome c-type biogenesis protein CcmH/NrfG
MKPDYGSAHAQLGRMLMYLKRPQEAVESLTRAFRIQPNLRKHAPYLSALAKGLGDLGRIEDALSAYWEAARLDPKDVEVQAGILQVICNPLLQLLYCCEFCHRASVALERVSCPLLDAAARNRFRSHEPLRTR